ncbi:MAG: DNA-binding transcriptional LysR family regulator [Parasphingorhabdus sp.]|jgi:DNA-binding transcriptional LysR family regulator|uniref:LysR family transcriptional regulator n=1 Tax=Parasphingorhabdus sp. TaxID=2709688 RepID=UPI0039E28F69
MDLNKWRHAVGVADHGSFTAAAMRLHISQPALSRSIQSLERELGLVLFERGPAGIAITAVGQPILEQARALLGQAEALQVSVRDIVRGDAGAVRFGVGPMFATLLDQVLPALWQPKQSVTVQAHVLPVERLVVRLLRGELDFFIADGRAARGQKAIAVEPLGEAPVGYFVRPSHPLAARSNLKISELASFPRVAPNLPEATIEQDRDIRMSSQVSAGQLNCERLDLLVRMASGSDAVLLAIAPMIEDTLASGELVRLDISDLRHWRADIVLARSALLQFSPLVRRYAEAFGTAVTNRIATAA